MIPDLSTWLLPRDPEQVADLTEAEYAAEPGVRSSLLRELAVSPWHAMRSMQARHETTEAMLLGGLLHEAVLTPTAPSRFRPHGYKSVNCAARDAIEKNNPGKSAVPMRLVAQAADLASAIQSHNEAAALLSGDGWNELAILWTDESGVACKCRFDRIRADYHDDGKATFTAIDIKTTSGACTADSFARTVRDYSYDLQAAHYLAGLRAVYGGTVPWWWIVVEKDTGCVAVHRADAGLIEWAETKRRRLMACIAECITYSRWPSPPAGVIEKPRWEK